MTKTVSVGGKTYRFQIWDTAGQERVRNHVLSCVFSWTALVTVSITLTNVLP